MVIFIMTNAPENLRGELTKWVMEVKAGVFVGNLSKSVRDRLWKKVVEVNVPDALMIYNYNNEQGYNIEMIGDPYRFVKDYEGLLLIGRKIRGIENAE